MRIAAIHLGQIASALVANLVSPGDFPLTFLAMVAFNLGFLTPGRFDRREFWS